MCVCRIFVWVVIFFYFLLNYFFFQVRGEARRGYSSRTAHEYRKENEKEAELEDEKKETDSPMDIDEFSFDTLKASRIEPYPQFEEFVKFAAQQLLVF